MISNQLLRCASTSNLIRAPRLLPLVTRFGSTLSQQSPPNSSKSAKAGHSSQSSSEYLAADMYDYNLFSYYDIEASMTKYRLPQPSAYTPLKADPAPQKK